MDEASVFTIHGFCQRMLSLNAFVSACCLSNSLLKITCASLSGCADFWRRHCYPLQRDIAEAVHALWKGPEALLRAIDRYLQGEAPVIKSPPPADETLASRHEKIIAKIADIKQKWMESVGEIDAIIENSGTDLT